MRVSALVGSRRCSAAWRSGAVSEPTATSTVRSSEPCRPCTGIGRLWLPTSSRALFGLTSIVARSTGGRTKVPTPRRISVAPARSSSAIA